MSELVKLKTKNPDIKQKNSNIQMRKSKHPQSINTSADRILFLQRTIGNQAVSRLIKSRTLQAKLKIGQPGDIYEQEADRMAERVMHMPEPGVQREVEPEEEEEEILQAKPLAEQITPRVQRQVEPEEEEEEELQMKAGPITVKNPTFRDKDTVSSPLESSIRSMRVGGRALNEQERSFFEPRMGVDFSSVRLHSEPEAANTATAIGARAFTVENHIAVAGGEYNFHSPQGKQLMAHELTHVLQNSNPDTVRRIPVAGLKAAEWLAVAALGYVVAQDAVKNSSGDISWKLDEMNGVLLPGGRTDVNKYKEENPGLTVQTKELVIAFWYGKKDSRRAGIKMGLSFNTDGKGIGNVSARIIDPYDWVFFGATCTVDLMPQTFVSKNGKAVIRVTLTNSWDHTFTNGVDSGIWNLEGDGSFSNVRRTSYLWEAHSLI